MKPFAPRRAIGAMKVLAAAALLAAVGSFTLGAAAASGTPVSFLSDVPIASPKQIWSLTTGDFNADGWPDLAGAVRDSFVVAWTNRKDGGFDPAVSLPCWLVSDAVVSADFDRDGRDDLAVVGETSPAGAISILLSSIGGFSLPKKVPVDSIGVVAIVAADLDGDGDIDLVVGNRNRHTVWLLTNDGMANFAASQLAKLPGGGSQLWLADADGDGDDDILVAQSSYWTSGIGGPLDSCWVVPNLGAGSFGGPAATGVLGALLATDLTGDGIADIVAARGIGSANGWNLHRGLGGGTFASGDSIAAAGYLARAPAADLDGDGRKDLIREWSGGTLNYFVPYFQRSPGVFSATEPYWSKSELLAWAIADFDGDGAPDLAHGLSELHVRVNHHGRFGGMVAYDQGVGVNSVDLATGDTDGDGALDVAVANLYASSRVFHNHGDGTLGAVTRVPLTYVRQVSLCDINGDAKADLIAQWVDQPNSRTYFAPDTGSMWRYPASGDYSPALYSHAAADWDANGSIDVLLEDGAYLRNDGAGNFTRYSFASGGADKRTIGDFDTDSRMDASSVSADSFYYRPNLLGVTLGSPTPVYAGGTIATTAGGYAVGDVDADGRTDFVARLVTGELTCVRNLGSGLFSPPQISAIQTTPAAYLARGLTIGDFDGDGLGDVAVFSLSGPSGFGPPPTCVVRVLRGLGSGVFGEPADFSAGTDFGVATAADMDGNGADDLTWVQGYASESRLLSILFSAAAPQVTPVLVSNLAADAYLDRVALAWWVGGDGAASVMVERSEAGAAWRTVATLHPDGSGRVSWEDRDVTPGARYGYRLRVRDGAAERTLGEVWVTVPERLTFGIVRVWPNPSRGDRVRVRLALDRRESATLELLDVAGRVVARRVVAAGEPGERDADLEPHAALAPGLYFVRARQLGRSATARLAVTR